MSYVGPPHRMSSAHHVSFMYIRGIHLQLFHTQLSLFILQAILTPPTPLAGPYFTMDFYPVHGSVLEGVCSAVSIFSELCDTVWCRINSQSILTFFGPILSRLLVDFPTL